MFEQLVDQNESGGWLWQILKRKDCTGYCDKEQKDRMAPQGHEIDSKSAEHQNPVPLTLMLLHDELCDTVNGQTLLLITLRLICETVSSFLYTRIEQLPTWK